MEWNGVEEGGKEPLLQGCWLAAWAGKISREEWMAWGSGTGGASRVTLPLRKRVRDSRNELWASLQSQRHSMTALVRIALRQREAPSSACLTPPVDIYPRAASRDVHMGIVTFVCYLSLQGFDITLDQGLYWMT